MIRHTVKAHKMFLRLGIAGFVTCSFLGLSSVSLAQTEPELAFRPIKAWSVNAQAIEVSSAQVQNCTISNEFNNGFVVSINGSHKWVQSLSLDLRQAALERGNLYDVSLSVPGLAKEKVSGVASEENVLIIDLKGQKDLYQTMRDSAVLDIGIEDNNFRFYMVNFAPAAKQFERCMAGGEIQPLTNSADKPLQASASEDPYTKFTSNESIAFEEEARTAENTDMSAAGPAPVAQLLPYKETKKVGGHIVQQTNVDPNATGDDVVEVVTTPEPQEGLNADKRSLAENAVNNARPEPRQRMTQMLAQDIQENPEIAAIDEDEQLSELPSPVEEITSEEIVADVAPPVTVKAEPKMAKELIIPPMMDDIPLDTALVEKDSASAPQSDLPAPAAAPDESSTIEDLNRQQLEKIAARKARSDGWKDRAQQKVTEVKQIEPPEYSQTETLALSEGAPFSQNLEKVTALSDPSLKDEIIVETISAQPVPEVETSTIAQMQSPEKEELLPVQNVETTNIKTPSVVRNREVNHLEADFTGLGDMEPAGSGAAQVYRDPDIGRKISELEKMINELEQENAALKSELEVTLEDTKQERMNISSDNWNLERATMRFDEAERQVKNLGQQLQRERTQCTMEKKELESLLFDPEVTNNAQLARLAELERQLMSCKGDL